MKENAPVLRTIKGPSNKGRVIVIGDIHGCIDELRTMLERVSPRENDVVISTGDIVRKGPRPDLCLELWRDNGYFAVVGNNEQKLLSWAGQRWRRWIMSRVDRSVVRRNDLIEYIASWPVVIDIPSVNASVVHGGFFPRMRVSPKEVEEHRDDLVRMRFIRRVNKHWERVSKGEESGNDILWAEKWRGRRTVLYGHTPVLEVRVDESAIGLDTGCVYGGYLSAAIHEKGKWRFERVRAKRPYISG